MASWNPAGVELCTDHETATPVMPLGTSSFVRFYAVFPHLKTVGKTAKCPIFKKWHDDVINPAFDEALRAANFRFHEEHALSHKLVLLKSETERDEMMRPDVRLTPIKTRIRQQNLPALWNAVVRKTTQPGFEEYGDVFLVAVFDHLAVSNGGIDVGITSGETQEESVTRAMEIWERDVDMCYMPRGRLEYRVESSWRF